MTIMPRLKNIPQIWRKKNRKGKKNLFLLVILISLPLSIGSVDPRPTLSQPLSFKIRRTTFLSYIKLADLLLWML